MNMRFSALWHTCLRVACPLLGLLAALPAQAFCGFYAGKADAELFNEASQVILVRDGPRTVLSMLNDYKGPLNEFALIVPTPVALKQGQVKIADKASFERLDAFSSPRLAEYHDQDPCHLHLQWGDYPMPRAVPAPMMAKAGALDPRRAKELGVTVEAKYTLEEYDIVSLSAKQSDGLETWLRENGYHIPKGTSAALKPYINLGMKFFVAKVNLKEAGKTGFNYLRPLQFAFESEKFMLPMRLGMLNAAPNQQQDLIVYVLTKNGRVESSNYRTAKLPANVNLPPFIKPRFGEFYKAMFANSARKEDYRVVFTEYFWDMNWCDPCAANPLSSDELKKAGVFWLDGKAVQDFAQLQKPNGVLRLSGPTQQDNGAREALITRLHLRYTPQSFPEDLMLTQTRDRENWQTRYVIQNPFAGSVAQCTQKAGQLECEKMCKPKVEQIVRLQKENAQWLDKQYQDKDEPVLRRDCVAACQASKVEGIRNAIRYYGEELPQRLRGEKKTLADLSGWSAAQIEAMQGAPKPVQEIAKGMVPK